MMLKGKKGAEESNVIIFIVLALIVAGLVIFFSWNFFSKGTAILDATDPVVQSALQACKAEAAINEGSWCNSIKYVPYADSKQYVTCFYLNSKTGTTIETSTECEKTKVTAILEDYCLELSKSNTGSFKEYINGQLCEKDKDGKLTFDNVALPRETVTDETSPAQ